jgi:cell wall-associated NlpC family hydrolase
MKKACFTATILLIIACLISSTLHADSFSEKILKDGDIIFQESRSSQSRAIQLATKSRYTHVGMIFKQNNQWMVLEAVQPVRYTSLKVFIARSTRGHFAVKRLANADAALTPPTIEKMKQLAKTMLGKNYDLYFEWSDSKIYCSELVWKIYERALHVEVGKLARLKEFDLSNPIVQSMMKQRYGNNIPLDEPVISPEAMFRSELLTTVYIAKE